MITAPKLYLRRKDIPIQSLIDMDVAESSEKAAELYNSKLGGLIDPDYRSTTVKIDIRPIDYPDVCNQLVKMVSIWDPSLDPNDFMIREFNYLKYGKGDKFSRHRDVIEDKNDGSKRIFSTSTIIKTSEDLTGGDFYIYDKDNVPFRVDLEVGETIFFNSLTDHEVVEVKQGNREVLVAWISYK